MNIPENIYYNSCNVFIPNFPLFPVKLSNILSSQMKSNKISMIILDRMNKKL